VFCGSVGRGRWGDGAGFRNPHEEILSLEAYHILIHRTMIFIDQRILDDSR